MALSECEGQILPPAQAEVLLVLAMYAEPRGHGLPLASVREYADVRGRPLAGALTGLRSRGLAWRGASGHWRPTEAGVERGRA
jgi:hypothetical protein